MEEYIAMASRILDRHISVQDKKYERPQEYKIRKIINYINKIKSIEKENSYEHALNYINNMTFEIIKILSGEENYIYQLEASERLALKNSFKEQYSKYEESELSKQKCDTEITYNSNLDRSYQLMIHEAKSILNKVTDENKEEYSKKMVILNEYQKSKVDKKNALLKQHPWLADKSFKLRVKNFSGTDYENVYNIIQTYNEYIKDTLKQKQIEILVFLGEFFEKFGLLQDYIERHDKFFREIKGIDLSYKLETGKFNNDSIGLKELFSKEFLENQDISNVLLPLSLFWQNRFSKEIKDINDSMFFIRELGLENIDYIQRIVEDNYFYVENKIECVRKLSKYIESATRKGIGIEQEVEGGTIININEELLNVEKNIGDKYNEYFSGMKPDINHNIIDDMYAYITCINDAKNAYRSKDSLLIYLIRKEIEKKEIGNWGIIQSNKKNTNERKKTGNILIGIDIEGLNMPLRLHMDPKEIVKTLIDAGRESIIPKYQGTRDFEQIDGKIIPTNVLMPLQEKQVKSIKQALKKTNNNKKNNKSNSINRNIRTNPDIPFFEHMIFLSNNKKMPKHFDTNPMFVNLKNKKVKEQDITE